MASLTCSEGPRQLLSVPTPYGGKQGMGRAGHAGTVKEDTIRALRDKLADFKAENTLLGALVTDLKVERDGLSKRLMTANKQLHEATSKADTASKDQQRLQAEVDRLSSIVHSHSVRLQKHKSHQQELEDVALDLRSEVETLKQQLEAAQEAAQQAEQKCVAAEAKLMAAGLGNGQMPKMGPTAEQLIINSTQRIKELTEELQAAKAEVHEQASAHQQALQHVENHWQQQLKDAEQACHKQLAAGEQRHHQQELAMQQQLGRLQAAEQQCKQLTEQLLCVQQQVTDSQAAAQVRAELDQVRHSMLGQNQNLQQKICSLQGQLADAELLHAATLTDQHQQLQSLQRQLSAVQREKQELMATLVALRQHESGHRIAAGEATAKAERLRSELLKCVGELQAQLEMSAGQARHNNDMLQQLKLAESTAAAARQEAAETRQQLVELATATMAELREDLAGEAAAITGLPSEFNPAELPLPVASYIKVLEQAVYDCEQRCRHLLGDTLTAQQQEQQVRRALAVAQEQTAAAERAVQQQTQRLLAVEKMRLGDLQEAQSLENRLMVAQQESWNLRESLLAARAGQPPPCCSPAASTASALQCAAAGNSTEQEHTAACDASQQQQQQHNNGMLVSAATAAASTSAASGLMDYHAKLSQIKQLREKLKSGSGNQHPAPAAPAPAAAAEIRVAGLKLCNTNSNPQPVVAAVDASSAAMIRADSSGTTRLPADRGSKSLQAVNKASSSCQQGATAAQRCRRDKPLRHTPPCAAAENEEHCASDALLGAATFHSASPQHLVKPADWSALMKPAVAAAAVAMDVPLPVRSHASTAAAASRLLMQQHSRMVDACAAGGMRHKAADSKQRYAVVRGEADFLPPYELAG